ncbi:DUF6789 family protein [Halobacteriaceae archaeon GCM10025711]
MTETETPSEAVEERRVQTEPLGRNAMAGIAGGVLGTLVMTAILLVVTVVADADLQVFQTVAELTTGGGSVLFGFLMFFAAGALAWPLFYVTLGLYFPGRTRVRQALLFAAVLWMGFVIAFARLYTGLDLAVFLGFSVVTHLLYGYILGAVFARITGQYESPELLV